MEWISCIHKTIKYIEENLLEENCAEKALREIYMSPMLFNKGFQILTGYSPSTYVRNRRLYLAGKEIKETDRKILDIALDYGFETAESFTKAFTRFHGSNPTQVRQGADLHVFLPLKINLSVYGGDQLKCTVRHMEQIKIAGYVREFASEDAREKIPGFWDEVLAKDNSAGEYALCIDDMGKEKFHYLIGKKIDDEKISDGIEIYVLPEQDWAVFECHGKNPEAIQSLDEKIWKEWLPGNSEYELDGNINVEWYGKNQDSAVWLPVKSI